jgi:hypothetical protein
MLQRVLARCHGVTSSIQLIIVHIPVPSTTNHLYASHYRRGMCAPDWYSAALVQTLDGLRIEDRRKDLE